MKNQPSRYLPILQKSRLLKPWLLRVSLNNLLNPSFNRIYAKRTLTISMGAEGIDNLQNLPSDQSKSNTTSTCDQQTLPTAQRPHARGPNFKTSAKIFVDQSKSRKILWSFQSQSITSISGSNGKTIRDREDPGANPRGVSLSFACSKNKEEVLEVSGTNPREAPLSRLDQGVARVPLLSEFFQISSQVSSKVASSILMSRLSSQNLYLWVIIITH